MTKMLMQLSCLGLFVQFSFLLDLPLKKVMARCLSIDSGSLLMVLSQFVIRKEHLLYSFVETIVVSESWGAPCILR